MAIRAIDPLENQVWPPVIEKITKKNTVSAAAIDRYLSDLLADFPKKAFDRKRDPGFDRRGGTLSDDRFRSARFHLGQKFRLLVKSPRL
jgi:hypothetical protein